VKISSGTIVKVRDFKDEEWELAWYIKYDKDQQAHRVTMAKPSSATSTRLYNYAIPVVTTK
jgi:hypothetical protein